MCTTIFEFYCYNFGYGMVHVNQTNGTNSKYIFCYDRPDPE